MQDMKRRDFIKYGIALGISLTIPLSSKDNLECVPTKAPMYLTADPSGFIVGDKITVGSDPKIYTVIEITSDKIQIIDSYNTCKK